MQQYSFVDILVCNNSATITALNNLWTYFVCSIGAAIWISSVYAICAEYAWQRLTFWTPAVCHSALLTLAVRKARAPDTPIYICIIIVRQKLFVRVCGCVSLC